MTDDRPCTCPPMERPHPCARKFALSECRAAAALDPICYRWRHQRDEAWRYGRQPQHLVPPRGKELVGYYIVQPLYTADALAAAREQALEEAIMCCPGGAICDPQVIADAIRALKKQRSE